MQLIPLADNILVELHEGRKLAAQLVLPEQSEHLEPYAKIVAVGPDVAKLAVGDLVLFHPQNLLYTDNPPGKRIGLLPAAACFAKYIPDNVTSLRPAVTAD